MTNKNLQADRNNKDKPQLSLIPRTALEEEAKVLKFGADKYGRDNWKQLWGKDTINTCCDSAFRHLIAMIDNELVDSESQLYHAAHVRANMAFILYYLRQLEEKK